MDVVGEEVRFVTCEHLKLRVAFKKKRGRESRAAFAHRWLPKRTLRPAVRGMHGVLG